MSKKRSDTKSHEEWVASFKNDKVILLGRYNGRNHPIKVECANPNCKHIWHPRAAQVQKGQGCPICQYTEKSQNYRTTVDEFDRRLADIHGNKIKRVSSDDEFAGINGPVEFLCLVCNHVWTTTGNSVVNGVRTGCPHCCNSKNEKLVEAYLDERKLSYERGVTVGDCTSANGGLSFFDFVIRGTEQIIIEVDGEQHFRSIAGWDFPKTVVSDILKTEYCEKHKIPLLRIKYDQIKKSDTYKEIIDIFLTDPNSYLHRHNPMLSNDEYYSERDISLKEDGIDIPGLRIAVEIAPKERRGKPVYIDAKGRKFSDKSKMCKANHISLRTYEKRLAEGLSTSQIFEKKCVYDHEGNPFASNEEMCRYWNVSSSTFHSRINKGWSIEKTLTTISRKKALADKDGTSLSQRARDVGMKPATVLQRLATGKMKLEDALNKPLRTWNVDDGMGNTYRNQEEMCNAYGLSINTYRTRRLKGMDKITALTTPVNRKKSHIKLGYVEDHHGQRYETNAQMCEKYGIVLSTFLARRQKGWDLESALTRPLNEKKPIVPQN